MCERIFLDWTEPCLPAAAAWLIDRRTAGEDADLSGAVCVLPGARAGWLLLNELLGRAASANRPLIPPRIITPGAIAHTLLRFERPVATSAELLLAWMTACANAASDQFAGLIEPDDRETIDRSALARVLTDLADVLAAGEKSFADVARITESLGLDREATRWQALAGLERAWLAVLIEAGLDEPMRSGRRLAEAGAMVDAADVILIGVAELNAHQRRILGACRNRLAALVHAPESHADAFDTFGCVRAEAWAETPIEIPPKSIRFVDRPVDQAQETLRILAESPERTANEFTIGLGNTPLQSTLVRQARWAGVELHPAAGVPLAGAAPLLLLEDVANWLDENRFVHLTALLRHPDVEDWLREHIGTDEEARRGVAGWLGLLEAYFEDHLHQRVTGSWLGSEADRQRLRVIHTSVVALLARFDRPPRTLHERCAEILAFLADVFGDLSSGSAGRGRTCAACLKLRDILAELTRIKSDLQPELTAPEAIRFVLARAGNETIPAEVRDDQIDLLGWLELHLDLAPVLILTGVNDGSIPSTVVGDAFLPDGLRRSLGLGHNETRVARDAYLLSAILRSRDEVHLIVGRHGETGEPLAPSRFLFRCDDETVLARVRALCENGSATEAALPFGLAPSAARTQFEVPALPDVLQTPDSMRITEFRLYLACPYRYALERLVGLESIRPAVEELDPLRFGSLAHTALERFGRDPGLRDATDENQIAAFLMDQIDQLAAHAFGDDLAPAVHVQLANLKQRLRGFAHWQAQCREERWEIRHCEMSFGNGIALQMRDDEPPMPLRGKIDRIDYHPDTKTWRVIDYKTGESGESPYKVHHGRERLPTNGEIEWRDLQLPLYHYLVEQAGIVGDDPIELGYVVLPKRSRNVQFRAAPWTDEHLREAVEVARQVVRDIRAGIFPLNREYDSFEQFPRICQSLVYGGADDDSDDGDPA